MVRYWGTSIAMFTAEGNGMLQGHTPVRWLNCFIALWSRIYGGCTYLYLMGFYKPTPRYFNIILKYIIYTHKHPSVHPFIHPCVHVCMHTDRRTYDMYCIYKLYTYIYIHTYIYIYHYIPWCSIKFKFSYFGCLAQVTRGAQLRDLWNRDRWEAMEAMGRLGGSWWCILVILGSGS